MNISYNEWEKKIQSTGIPANNESRLAFQTLKICISDNRIDDSFERTENERKITNNGYALFDYTMYCYFVFRAKLCMSFTRNFVELYDAYIQTLMSLYFLNFFDIPQETTKRLIISRARAYDQIAESNPQGALKETLDLLCQFIAKDFNNTPETDNIVIDDIFDQFDLYMKLSNYLPTTIELLDKQAELFAYAENAKKTNCSPTHKVKVNHEKAQQIIKKYEQDNRYSNNIKQSKEKKDNIVALILGTIKSKFRCPKCKTKIPFNSQYCYKCGCQIRIKCDNCGKMLKKSALYCSKCGKQIKNKEE